MISNLIKYNYIFKYYLLLILIFNIFMSYTFVTYFFYNKSKFNNLKDTNDNNFDSDNNLELIYYYRLKQIIKLFDNPIKFDYQINQINQNKIYKNNSKYVQYKNEFNKILKIKTNTKINILYKKIILKIKKNDTKNKCGCKKILLCLFCINC